jgi:hypothetical protein
MPYEEAYPREELKGEYFIVNQDEDQKLIDLRERLIESYLHDILNFRSVRDDKEK